MTDTAAFNAAFAETTGILDGLVAQLTPEHREKATPCKDFTVHDLMNHIAGGAHMISAMYTGAEMGEAGTDHMVAAGGPVPGWAAAKEAMRTAFSEENLTSIKPTPVGEMPGIGFASVIVADHLIHAWDLATAIGADVDVSDATVELVGNAMRPLITPESRNGDTFEDEKPFPADATTLQQLVAYSGRTVG